MRQALRLMTYPNEREMVRRAAGAGPSDHGLTADSYAQAMGWLASRA